MKTSLSIQYAQTQLGIVSLRKHQIEPIQSILNGHDTMVIAPTSAGKSAIYQLPALIKAEERQWTLVIEPTLSLISDQVQKRRLCHQPEQGRALRYLSPSKPEYHIDPLYYA